MSPIAPDEFYALAEHLTSADHHKNEEAAQRTAVSRAYYAALLHVTSRMSEWGCEFRGTGATHAKVRQALKGSKSPSLVRIGSDLGKSQRERERADYDIHEEVVPAWQVACSYYHRVTGQLDTAWNHHGAEKRRQVVRAMQVVIDALERQIGRH